MEDLGPKYSFTEEILLKKNLRNYKLDSKANDSSVNISILVHKVDGRLLLTGKSGIYEDYIREKFKFYNGNLVLLLLDEFEDDLTEPGQTAKPLVNDAKIYTIDGESYCETKELRDSIYDQEIVSGLSDTEKGNQPIIGTLADHFKLIYVKGVINYYQL